VSGQDELYERAAAEFGAALARLARGYEADPDKRRDLIQDIHVALWRSLDAFSGRCSLRTWVYRVAHNTAISYSLKQRRGRPSAFVSLDQIDLASVPPDATREIALVRLMELVHRLKPLDRQVILTYLDGLEAAEIGEMTGLSPSNVATRIHRIKKILARDFQEA
jgi:RNA polymerase sigma-70 factor (ECF subfamily)